MKKFLMAGAAFLALTSAASAADLAARPYTKAAPIDPGYNWSGFYVGVHGGYGWSDRVTAGVVGGFGGLTTTTTSSDFNGGFGGGQIGYNWQVSPNWVFGLEADAAGADIRYTETTAAVGTFSSRIDAFGSVTGRIGYAANNWLFYGKGGWGWADNRVNATILGVGGGSFSDSNFHSGWTAGGGIEYGFARNWSVKAEYQYYDFDNHTYFNGLVLGSSLHTVKGGLNYRF